MDLVVRAARLIDGTGSDPLERPEVLIRDGRIAGVRSQTDGAATGDATVIDLAELTLLPGLIDTHLHFVGNLGRDGTPMGARPVAEAALGSAVEARRMLDAGFTTVRDCGSRTTPTLKRMIDQGHVTGPRIVAAGTGITQAFHRWYDASIPLERGWVRFAYGPDECKRAVDLTLREGADFIKIGTATGTAGAWGKVPVFSVEEIRAIVEEAHTCGVKVAAHCMGDPGVRNALLGGVDCIEHGYGISPETVRLMRDQGAILTPTLWLGAAADHHFRTEERATIRAEQNELVRRAAKAGVPIAAGTDCTGSSWLRHGGNAEEFALLVEAGLTPMQAIVAGTRTAARALDLEREVGTVEPGKWADLIAVPGNPLDDIAALGRVEWVMLGGQVTRDISPAGAVASRR